LKRKYAGTIGRRIMQAKARRFTDVWFMDGP
jgi:hypothetical protein